MTPAADICAVPTLSTSSHLIGASLLNCANALVVLLTARMKAAANLG
jgi:hypothetical protein